MKHTPRTWPIGAKMAFGPTAEDGAPIEHRPEEWMRQLDQVTRLGFSCIDPTDDWLPFWTLSTARFGEFREAVESRGLSFSSLSMGRRSVVDVQHGEEHLELSHRFIDIAERVGSPVVNVGFMQPLTAGQESAMWFWHVDGHIDDPALRDLAIERIRELADHGAASGIGISLEMYEDTYCGTADDAVAFVVDVDRDNVGLNPDIGNLVRLHRPIEPWESAYAKVLPYANFWHIKNYVRDEDPATGTYFSAPAPLETGTINYRAVIERALRVGFDGPFLAEHYGGDWLGVSARNLHYIREVLASALDC